MPVITGPACRSAPGHDDAACTRIAAGGYCAPKRCYCGGCPWYVSIDERATNTPDWYTVFDKRAVDRGQRVSGERRRAAR